MNAPEMFIGKVRASTMLALRVWVAGDRVRSRLSSPLLAGARKSARVRLRPLIAGTPATVTGRPASALRAGSMAAPPAAETTLPPIA